MKYLPFVLFLSLTTSFTSAQTIFQRLPLDHIWLLPDDQHLDFNETPVQVRYAQRPIGFSGTIASICDEEGQLKMYTNGIRVVNGNNGYLENGFRINPSPLIDEWMNSGSRVPQWAIILPHSIEEESYHIIYEAPYPIINEEGQQTVRVLRLHYALADFSDNNSGVLVEKDFPLIIDTLDFGKVTACRHGNGRDWWVLIPYIDANEYHRFLLGPDGIEDWGSIRSGEDMSRGLGQAQFSPDGAKYINYGIPTFNNNYLTIYDFDRCTGLLTNAQTRYDTAFAYVTGIAISENSHFAYESAHTHLYQYDLTASDIFATRTLVAEYDGYYAGNYPDITNTTFSFAQLAPDGKIYLTNAGSALSLHILQAPNKRGYASRMEQHVLDLPTWTYNGIPNFPYYGLGPWDGSPCDTLNIDNPVPEAVFEYTPDSLGLAVEFFDASHYASTWEWDFGDGSPSITDQHPLHTYNASGTYEVCLQVSNVTGSDLYCETLFVGTTNSSELTVSSVHVNVWPNPVSGPMLNIEIKGVQQYTDLTLLLKDALGKIVSTQAYSLASTPATLQLQVSSLASGLYFYEVHGERLLASGKVIIE